MALVHKTMPGLDSLLRCHSCGRIFYGSGYDRCECGAHFRNTSWISEAAATDDDVQDADNDAAVLASKRVAYLLERVDEAGKKQIREILKDLYSKEA